MQAFKYNSLFFIDNLFIVNSPSIIAMMIFPGLAIKLLSTIIKSLSLIPAFIIESPLTLRKKVLNGLDIKCSFKSIFSSVQSSAGEGNPAYTESVNNVILNFLVAESKESNVKLIVYMYYIAKNKKQLVIKLLQINFRLNLIFLRTMIRGVVRYRNSSIDLLDQD